jgi:multicomponent Na+:H+ antiporter subunit B
VSSVILRTSARLLEPLILFFSVYVLFRGHDEPGGGFTGGPAAAAAFVLHAFARGMPAARRALRFDGRTVAASGLVLAVVTAIAPLLLGRPLFDATWVTLPLGPFGEAELGTPLVFDAGVYLVVLGSTTALVSRLGET